MASKRASGTRSEVIRCPNCGEDYSVTYKRCPFCDERSREPEDYYDAPDEDEEEAEAPRKTGKRAAPPRRGGGYGGGPGPLRIIVTILSLALIVAAVWIVFSWVAPLVDRSNIEPTPSPSATLPPASPTVAPSAALPGVTGDPGAVLPEGTQPPAASPSPTLKPAQSSSPTGKAFTLNREDFSLRTQGETFTMKATGATGSVTWSSENPAVATIDANGKVTAVATGTTNIVGTASDGAVVKCIVRCTWTGGAAASAPPAISVTTAPTTAAPSAGGLTLNREDFSFQQTGETFTMKVSGTASTPAWSIDKTSVATIDANGKVTAVGAGKATVTCKVDGKTLTCIVRCQF